MKGTLLAFSALLMVGCGSHDSKPDLPNAPRSFGMMSTTFQNHGPLPPRCSADGGNLSPELHWGLVPAGTKSLVITVQDPDAPGSSPYVHWLVWSIPPDITQVAEGQTPKGSVLGKNDAGTDAYFGPKPPSGTHHYRFRIYALDVMLNLPAGSTEPALTQAMNGHTRGMAEMVGTFSH